MALLLSRLASAQNFEDDLQPERSYLIPPAPPSRIGHPDFCRTLSLTYPYMAGAMANGISSVDLVAALATEGMLASFGAAGLPIQRIEAAIDQLQMRVGSRPFAVNLIHSPAEPRWEHDCVELLLAKRVRLVEASAYMDLNEALLRYRLHGICERADGSVETPNQLIAKVSRVELAEKFMSPAPDALLQKLLQKGQLTPSQVDLAKRVPIARFITAEADSGGHTDNRPATVLLPLMQSLRQRIERRYGYHEPILVGLAGGIGTPHAVAAALTMGAAYVVTGTVNQACVESGTSDLVRSMLAEAGQADVAMAPAADMFEMGIKVQVLKRGSLFPMRAQKLFDIYRAHASLEDICAEQRSQLEKQLFRQDLASVWEDTKRFLADRDPGLIARAEANPKFKMALVFRSYLGRSSNWANAGEANRKLDFQVWCGPVMGAFNEWARGSFLETSKNRRAANIGLNLLVGAAILQRSQSLRLQACFVPEPVLDTLLRPKTDAELRQLISGEL